MSGQFIFGGDQQQQSAYEPSIEDQNMGNPSMMPDLQDNKIPNYRFESNSQENTYPCSASKTQQSIQQTNNFAPLTFDFLTTDNYPSESQLKEFTVEDLIANNSQLESLSEDSQESVDNRIHPHNEVLAEYCDEIIAFLQQTKETLLNPQINLNFDEFLGQFNQYSNILNAFQRAVEMHDLEIQIQQKQQQKQYLIPTIYEEELKKETEDQFFFFKPIIIDSPIKEDYLLPRLTSSILIRGTEEIEEIDITPTSLPFIKKTTSIIIQTDVNDISENSSQISDRDSYFLRDQKEIEFENNLPYTKMQISIDESDIIYQFSQLKMN